MTKQLILHDELHKCLYVDTSDHPSIRYVTIEGKEVAYFIHNRGGCIVVPGTVESDIYRTEHGRKARDVEPITDVEFQGKVKEALKGNSIDNYSWW